MAPDVKIEERSIGKVKIIDISGELVGPSALMSEAELKKLLLSSEGVGILINLKNVSRIDSLGVRMVIRCLAKITKCAVMGCNFDVHEMINRLTVKEKPAMRCFFGDNDVLEYFGKEFTDGQHGPFVERRKFKRMKAALPIEISYKKKNGEDIIYKAIATNLSEDGVYAEYLDLELGKACVSELNPNGAKLLKLKIRIPDGKPVMEIEGRVIHRQMENNNYGIGMQFCGINDGDRRRLKEYIG